MKKIVLIFLVSLLSAVSMQEMSDLELLANQGDLLAQNELGDMYYLETNYKEAFKWFELTAKAGNVDAQIKLGDFYQKGQGVKKNYKEALKYYKLAAEQGDDYAQYSVGYMYLNGYGTRQNYKEAAKWFELSNLNGNLEAWNKLEYLSKAGLIYSSGYNKDEYDVQEDWGNMIIFSISIFILVIFVLKIASINRISLEKEQNSKNNIFLNKLDILLNETTEIIKDIDIVDKYCNLQQEFFNIKKLLLLLKRSVLKYNFQKRDLDCFEVVSFKFKHMEEEFFKKDFNLENYNNILKQEIEISNKTGHFGTLFLKEKAFKKYLTLY